jgi:hypothetical protein
LKILHFFFNARAFITDCPFYNYYFKTEGIDSSICDFLDPGDNVPSIFVPAPLQAAYSEEDMKECVLEEKPDILHCHDAYILEKVLAIGTEYHLPVVFSVYRHNWDRFNSSPVFSSVILNHLKCIFVPNVKIQEILQKHFTGLPVRILKESLESHYIFSGQSQLPSAGKTYNFAALISESDEKYVENIHRSLEKILVTNHVLCLSWVCFDSKTKNAVSRSVEGKAYAKYVSITELANFPLLKYDGLITDGNKNKIYSHSQYFSLLMSILREGKLLITQPEPEFEDILRDGETCLVVEDYHSTKISHLVHFLICFPDEIAGLSEKAARFYEQNHSFKLMSAQLTEAYGHILSI